MSFTALWVRSPHSPLMEHEHEIVELPWHDGYILRKCVAKRGSTDRFFPELECTWHEFVPQPSNPTAEVVGLEPIQ